MSPNSTLLVASVMIWITYILLIIALILGIIALIKYIRHK
jgi:hypothetical protein